MPLQTIPPGTELGDLTFPHIDYHGMLIQTRYAAPHGDNANDGLTWGSAKKDIVSAYDALPAGGGTIYFANDTYADSVNTDRGLWLLNQDDPSYGGGTPTLPGWRVGKPLHLIGIGGQQHVSNGWARGARMLGGSGTDRLKPALWTAGGFGPTVFENVMFPANAVTNRLGVASDMVGGVAGTLNTATLQFKDCGFESSAFFANGGPTIEIGYLFWARWERCVFNRGNVVPEAITSIALQSGTTYRVTVGVAHRMVAGETCHIVGVTPAAYNGVWTITNVPSSTALDVNIGSNPGAVTVAGTLAHMRTYYRAAVAHDVQRIFPGGTNSGLLFFDDCNSNGGGIWYAPHAGLTAGNVRVENWVMEGDFVNPTPPIFHVPLNPTYDVNDPGGITTMYNVWVIGGGHADTGPGTDAAVRIEGRATPPVAVQGVSHVGNVHHWGPDGGARFGVMGPVSATGEWSGTTLDSHRAFGPVTARFPNFLSQEPADWAAAPSVGAPTLTTGQRDPAGGTKAGRLSGSSFAEKQIYVSSSIPWTVGDWIVVGTWRRFVSGVVGGADYKMLSYSGAPGFAVRAGGTGVYANRNQHDDTGWEWNWGYDQLTGAPSGVGNFVVGLRTDDAPASVDDFFAPVCVRIPASEGWTETEVEQFAKTLHTWPNWLPAGAVGLLDDQKLLVKGGIGHSTSNVANVLGNLVRKQKAYDYEGHLIGYVPVYDDIAQSPLAPNLINSVTSWWDFTDPTKLFTDTAMTTPVSADGQGIAAVADKKGTNHLTQASAASQALYKTAIVNGQSIGRWDGVNDGYFIPASVWNGKTGMCVLIAAKQPGTAFGMLLETNPAWDGQNGALNMESNGGNVRFVVTAAPVNLGQSNLALMTSWHVVGGWIDWSQGENAEVRPITEAGKIVSPGGDHVGYTHPNQGLTLGYRGAGPSSFWAGDIAHVVIWDTAPTAVDVNNVMGYICADIGLTATEIGWLP